MRQMIYPKCNNGVYIPIVTAQGYLSPCCEVTRFSYMKHKPFYDEAFSLHKHSYNDIVRSTNWIDMIKSFKTTSEPACIKRCGTNEMPLKLPTGQFTQSETYVPTKTLDTIQFEFTNRCTLKCLYCARLRAKERNIMLNRDDLDLSIVEDVLKSKHWKAVIDCGNHGDSIFYKYYHDMLNILEESVVDYYRLSTAATGQSEEWWEETQERWKILNDSGINVIIYWGIDGLEDTSRIHRVGQDWFKITTQMRIAARNGIECVWQFIPFSHNTHQINEARSLSKSWDVKFFLQRSDRFRKNDPMNPYTKQLDSSL